LSPDGFGGGAFNCEVRISQILLLATSDTSRSILSGAADVCCREFDTKTHFAASHASGASLRHPKHQPPQPTSFPGFGAFGALRTAAAFSAGPGRWATWGTRRTQLRTLSVTLRTHLRNSQITCKLSFFFLSLAYFTIPLYPLTVTIDLRPRRHSRPTYLKALCFKQSAQSWEYFCCLRLRLIRPSYNNIAIRRSIEPPVNRANTERAP
jgi:hypothetical protein